MQRSIVRCSPRAGVALELTAALRKNTYIRTWRRSRLTCEPSGTKASGSERLTPGATSDTGAASLAVEQLFEVLYSELRALAHRQLRDSPSTMLNTTALVHECYERMQRAGTIAGRENGQFLAYASRAMRSVLVDHARARIAGRRGGGAAHIELDSALDQPVEDEQILRVHDALKDLEARDAELAQVVEMRYFGGLSDREIAEVLSVTDRTVRRRFEKARVLLLALMQ